jgi:hypothetical protein
MPYYKTKGQNHVFRYSYLLLTSGNIIRLQIQLALYKPLKLLYMQLQLRFYHTNMTAPINY